MLQGRFACLSLVVLLGTFGSGCLPSIADLGETPLTETFAVSDYFAPSGYMGDGQYLGKLTGTPNSGCRPRAGQGRGNCYAFTYLPNDNNTDAWAGVFWVFPSNSWGSTRGRAIDITKFKQISFWAAVEGPTPYTDKGSPVPFQGQAGGIDPLGRYGDPKKTSGLDYVDGVEVKYGWTIGGQDGVTNEMKQFHIPLTDVEKSQKCLTPAALELAAMDPTAVRKAPNCSGTPLLASYIIGAFAFALHYPTDAPQCSDPAVDCHQDLRSSMFVNPPPVKIYLDDIVWDTEAPPTP
jgi:hypothetical protein